MHFKQQFAETYHYRAIGSWWAQKNGENEIDMVALKLEKNQAIVAEVKRQRKNFKPELLAAKVEHLRRKVLPKFEIENNMLDTGRYVNYLFNAYNKRDSVNLRISFVFSVTLTIAHSQINHFHSPKISI